MGTARAEVAAANLRSKAKVAQKAASAARALASRATGAAEWAFYMYARAARGARIAAGCTVAADALDMPPFAVVLWRVSKSVDIKGGQALNMLVTQDQRTGADLVALGVPLPPGVPVSALALAAAHGGAIEVRVAFAQSRNKSFINQRRFWDAAPVMARLRQVVPPTNAAAVVLGLQWEFGGALLQRQRAPGPPVHILHSTTDRAAAHDINDVIRPAVAAAGAPQPAELRFMFGDMRAAAGGVAPGVLHPAGDWLNTGVPLARAIFCLYVWAAMYLPQRLVALQLAAPGWV